MSGEQIGFFLVPAEHLAELYGLDEDARRAHKERPHDELYRARRTCFRAQELAVASALIALPDREWESSEPYLLTRAWLDERFANGQDIYHVYGLDKVATMKAHMERHGFQDFAAFARANRGGWVPMDPAVLRQYYDALEGVVRSALPGPHGLVVGSLREELREPPPPPEPEPEPEPEPSPRPPPTPEERANIEKMDAFFERMFRNSRRRQSVPWWHELTSEGRVLLGCLPAADGPGWLDMFRAAEGLGAVAWYATLRRFSDAVELALDHGLVDSSAGMVYALELIATELWRDRDDRTAVFPPEQVRAIRQRLDQVLEQHGGEAKFVRWLKKKERHWKIAIPRAALAALREQLDRAIETGSWLLWLPDAFDWPGER